MESHKTSICRQATVATQFGILWITASDTNQENQIKDTDYDVN